MVLLDNTSERQKTTMIFYLFINCTYKNIRKCQISNKDICYCLHGFITTNNNYVKEIDRVFWFYFKDLRTTSALPLIPKKNISAYSDIIVAFIGGRFSSGIDSVTVLIFIADALAI